MELLSLLVLGSFAAIPYFLYVSIIQKRNKAREAFSGIDVQLKKRYDVIPNILTIANRFMEHERELLTEITELRTKVMEYAKGKASLEDRFHADNQLQAGLSKLMVSVENYPQLKSDQTMVQAMKTYNEVEEHIAAARRFYNSAVTDLLNATQIFPGSLIASMINVQPMPFFEADEISRASVNAQDFFYKK